MPEEEITEESKSQEPADTAAENPDTIIRNHLIAAMAAGLIPVPLLDFVGISGIQLNLLRKLAKVYNIPFSDDMVKNLIAALIGGSLPASLGPYLWGSIAKVFPGPGSVVGAVSTSAVGGASTYAVGKAFNRHFAEGGTFLSFDPEKAKAFYAEMLKEGQNLASELKKKTVKNDSSEVQK